MARRLAVERARDFGRGRASAALPTITLPHTVGGERRGELAKIRRRPALRAAVRGARRERDERRAAVPAISRQQLRRRVATRPAARATRGSLGPFGNPSARTSCWYTPT